ncbi:MAG TPA: hypothetical protein VFZ25_09775 [Chloroflexota bacterium]|nr:hypothetical protein [Chloroflexota bacterium]
MTHSRTITKSVRLTPEESALVAEVSQREHLPEGALIRKLILDGLSRYRLDEAITEYATGVLNLGEAAGAAGVSVQRMLAELDRRGFEAVTPAHFRASLNNLVDLFGGSPEIRAILEGEQLSEPS